MTDQDTEGQLSTPRVFDNGWQGYLFRTLKLSARKLLPETVVRELRAYRAYQGREWSMYLKVRLQNRLGLTKPRLLRVPPTTRSIVFVCFGNIMRSPAAEAMMKKALAGLPGMQLDITSAGLNAISGTAAHPWAIETAREFGVSLEHHRSRRLTADMVAKADAIFAMDYQNQVQLLSRWNDSKNKVFMLSAYAGDDYKSVEIRDPYYHGIEETRRCYKVLNTCVENLVSSLHHETVDGIT